MGITTNPSPSGSNAAANEAAYGDPYSRPSPQSQGSNQSIVDTARAVTESLNQSAQRSGSNVRFTVNDGINPTVTKSEINPADIKQTGNQGSMGGGVSPANPIPSQTPPQATIPFENAIKPADNQYPSLNEFVATNQQKAFQSENKAPFQAFEYNTLAFLGGAVQLGESTLNLFKANPKENTLAQLFLNPPKPSDIGEQLRQQPAASAGQFAGALIIPELFGKGITKLTGVENIDIYGGVKTGTKSADIGEGSFLDISQSDIALKTGSNKEFIIQADTASLTVKDVEGTLLKADKTQFKIQELKPTGEIKNEFLGVARSDVQLREASGMTQFRGTTRGVVNINDFKAIGQQGELSGLTLKFGDEAYTGLQTSFTKEVKTKPVSFAEDLEYDSMGKTKQQSFSLTRTQTLAEIEAPLKIKLNVEPDVLVFSKSVTQRLLESDTVVFKGQQFENLKNSLNLENLKVYKTEGGELEVHVEPPKNINFNMQNSENALAVQKAQIIPENPVFPVSETAKNMIQIIVKEQNVAELKNVGGFIGSASVARLYSPSQQGYKTQVSQVYSYDSSNKQMPPITSQISLQSLRQESALSPSQDIAQLSALKPATSVSQDSLSQQLFKPVTKSVSIQDVFQEQQADQQQKIMQVYSYDNIDIAPRLKEFTVFPFFSGKESKYFDFKGEKRTKARKELTVFPLSSPEDIAVTSLFAKKATSPSRNKLKEFKISRAMGSDVFPTYQQRSPKGKSFTKGFLKRGFI